MAGGCRLGGGCSHLDADGEAKFRLVGRLRCDRGSRPFCNVCEGVDWPVFLPESGLCGIWILPVGSGQAGFVGGNADCCAKTDNGAELAGNADRLGGNNEGGLVGGDVFAPALETERQVTEWLLTALRSMV